jgi:putative flavoprotein involved in K+ transport
VDGNAERFETVIVGGAQAGLSVGYHLARRGRSYVILDANQRIGDSWRKRWDSLRLFTPARYDGLPGLRFPGAEWSFPSRDQMADYLEGYVARFGLNVRTGLAVDRVARWDGRYLVAAGGRQFEADNVVVASGTFQAPRTPAFAADLGPEILQLHSSGYRNPSPLRDGGVLVVGASNSGAEIALEAAASGHATVLSGRDTGQVPIRIESRPARLVLRVLWILANRVLTENTPMGRKLGPLVRSHGGPLVRVKRADLAAAGVERTTARTVGTRDGLPLLDDGRVVDVANVVWCTGFGRDYRWLQVPVLGEDGWPLHDRGVVASAPGIYFVGLPFLHGFGSMLIGGVGRDAEHVARDIASRTPKGRPAADALTGA